MSNQGKEDEVNALKQDSVRLTRQREAIQRKLRTIEDQKAETEHQKETLKNQINALEKGMVVYSYYARFVYALLYICIYVCNYKFFYFCFIFLKNSFFYILELEASKKQQEVDKKAIDDLVRERDILNKVLRKVLVYISSIF